MARLHRSTTDKQIAGVCAGLAEHLGVQVSMVRLVAVLLLVFTSAPVFIAYLIAWSALPEGTTEAEALEVDWQADGLRISWSAAIVPHSVPWPHWIAGVFGLTVALAVASGIAGAAATWLGLDSEILLSLLTMGGSTLWPALLLLAFGGLFRRPYALTVTHDALWIERPLRQPRRIDLAEVESMHEGYVLLRDGEVVSFPPPPPDVALDAFEEQLKRSRQRALGHRVDLEQAAAERRQLEAILAAREG